MSVDCTDFLLGEHSRSDFGLDRATAALLHCSFGGAAALGEPFMKSRCCQWWLFWLLRVAFFLFTGQLDRSISFGIPVNHSFLAVHS